MQRYITRKLEADLEYSLTHFPVTALLGPRQCGKTTLAKEIRKNDDNTVFLDLERPADLRKLSDPELFLNANRGKLICIDEIQHKPELFPLIRVLVDEDRRPGRFLFLGSASGELLRQTSESLAGRIRYLELTPFQYQEIRDSKKLEDIWLRGGFPDSVLASSETDSYLWRESFIKTFLARDIPELGFLIPSENLDRFWRMLCHYHGQVLNASKIGQSLGISYHTVKKYLGILERTFMLRVLQPFHANLRKRLVKSPKIYIRDSGILHNLLEIRDYNSLLGHPVFGSSWEGWCIEQICTALPDWRSLFYRTSSGEELDLLLEKGQSRLVFEFKASSAPKVSRGFAQSLNVLNPEKTWVVAPVEDTYPISEGAVITGIAALLDDLKEME